MQLAVEVSYSVHQARRHRTRLPNSNRYAWLDVGVHDGVHVAMHAGVHVGMPTCMQICLPNMHNDACTAMIPTHVYQNVCQHDGIHMNIHVIGHVSIHGVTHVGIPVDQNVNIHVICMLTHISSVLHSTHQFMEWLGMTIQKSLDTSAGMSARMLDIPVSRCTGARPCGSGLRRI